MTVTAIIPTYNRAGLVRAAVESVLAQTSKVDEIVVVDDGSTDGTERVVRGFGDRVIYHRIPNSGFACVPRNTGVSLAAGEFVAFLDSDDLWHPNKIERQLEAFGNNPELAMVYCDYDYVDESGAKIPDRKCPLPNKIERGRVVPTEDYWDDVFSQLVLGCFIQTSTTMIRRDILRRVGPFDQNLRFCEDRDMWMRVALAGAVHRVPESLSSYRAHGGSWTACHGDIYVANQKKLVKKMARLVNDDRARSAFLRKARPALRRQWASHLVTAAYEGDRMPGWKRARILLAALIHDPAMIREEAHVWKNAIKYCLAWRAGAN